MSGRGARVVDPRRSLRRRLGLALVAGATLLGILAGVAGWALVVMRDRQDAITGTFYRAITEADAAYIVILDAKTTVDAYLDAGGGPSLEVLDQLGGPAGAGGQLAAEAGVEAELRSELGGGHEVLRLRAEAQDALDVWYDDHVAPLVADVEAGGQEAATPAERRDEDAAFEALSAALGDYVGAVRTARGDANDELRAWIGVTTVAFTLLVAGAIAAGTLLWVFLRRWVTDPLGELAADARAVADGDVGRPVRETGPGEVGALAADVELMRERLVRLVEESGRARAQLEASHAELEEQAEELRRSNRDLEQFAYVASHDLQEPLRKVASFTQLLATRYRGRLDERADQYIDFAVDGAKRMQRLINDLLGFSRVGRIGTELTEVDLAAAFDQVVDDLQETVAETGARVSAEGLPTVVGEAPLLHQLLANLVGNALKFRHPDRAPVVRVTAERVGDLWQFACRDNGIGIDPQHADRVFVIFQRLHPKDVYEGTGIGLALCKKIVEFHGGDIWVDADGPDGAPGAPGATGAPGGPGTVVRWTLPAAPVDASGTGTGAGGPGDHPAGEPGADGDADADTDTDADIETEIDDDGAAAGTGSARTDEEGRDDG